MYLSTPARDVRHGVFQWMLGVFYGASVIISLSVASERCFPQNSPMRLAMPVFPLLGMFLVGIVATKLSRASSRRALAAGLWFGGFVWLSLYGMYLLAIGYLDWIATP
jgi:hypothetical protein